MYNYMYMANSGFKPLIARTVRQLTRETVLSKRLPKEFGGAAICVRPRSDLRYIFPGIHKGLHDLLEVAGTYVKPGDCVWDFGSNVGLFSFCAAWKAGAKGSVYTVEADPLYVALQHRTIANLPSGYAPVYPLSAAAASEQAILTLSVPELGHSRNHLSVVEGNDAGTTESTRFVAAVTADYLLDYWPKPAFVKVDVEGAELLFLKGASRLLRDVRPTIYIEVGGENTAAATQIFHAFDYELFSLDTGGQELPSDHCTFNTLARPRH